MTPDEAAQAEFNRTIIELQARLAQTAALAAQFQNQTVALRKELDALKPKSDVKADERNAVE